MENLKSFLEKDVFRLIASAAAELGVDAYVIGGYVRDRIMGRDTGDIDVLAIGSGIELASLVAEKLGKNTQVNYFKNFGTAMLKYQEDQLLILEFVGARKESYSRDSRKPLVENGTLEDDQNRRDDPLFHVETPLSPVLVRPAAAPPGRRGSEAPKKRPSRTRTLWAPPMASFVSTG